MLQFYGVAYTVGDFAVCVGRAMMRPGEELRGYMVEVEYLPVQEPQLARAALQARLFRLLTPGQSPSRAAAALRVCWSGSLSHNSPVSRVCRPASRLRSQLAQAARHAAHIKYCQVLLIGSDLCIKLLGVLA